MKPKIEKPVEKKQPKPADSMAPLTKLNATYHLFVLMQANYLSPTGYPRELVPFEKVAERLAGGTWAIVKRSDAPPKQPPMPDINNSHDSTKTEPKTFATPNDFGDWADFTQRP